MKNRWTFQLIVGSLWATFTVLFMLLAYKHDGSLGRRWNSGEIPIMIGLMYATGILFFGWFMWWQKEKQAKKKTS